MIKFDFNTYAKDKFDNNIFNKYYERKEKVFEQFNNSDMIGWTREVDSSLVSKIISLRDEIKNNSKCLVVIGIGGSYLGSYALNYIFENDDFKIIYLGNCLSSREIKRAFKYLDGKDFYVNVISKSGKTMESAITYSLVKDYMKKRYSDEEIKNRIIITTDEVSGDLRLEVKENFYRSFVIPRDIGGRYSLLTAAHLLPLSFNIDIERLIKGFYRGINLKDEAYYYACVRRSLFDLGKYIENYSVYETCFSYFLEWLKQLFGETEGKNKMGIFPVSTIGTRDLHSLGQFIQEGNPIIFETFIKILESDEVIYRNKRLNDINNLVLDSVVEAHSLGGVFVNTITIDKVDEENMGELCAFFMLSAVYSGYLFDVDPFNQPGVEVYKECVRNNLGRGLK